jgi:hypothetical protein
MKYLINIYNFLNEAKIEDIYSKYYSDIEDDIFNKIVNADPTSVIKPSGEIGRMGAYSKWLLQLYKTNNLLIEDLYKATDYLSKYHDLKRTNKLSGKEADINSYKSLPDLLDIIMNIGGSGKVDTDESYLLTDRYYINSGEAELFYEDNKYLIVIPKTLEASQFYAYNTEWCTYYPDKFKSYTDNGFLYIIIDKDLINTEDRFRRLQFHFESDSFMDIRDNYIYGITKNKFYSLFDGKIKDVYKLKYDRTHHTSNGLTIVDIGYRYGYINENGVEITPIHFNSANSFSDGVAIVSKDGKYGMIDKQGNYILDLKYTRITRLGVDYEVSEHNKWGVVNIKNGHVNIVVPINIDVKYIVREPFSNNVAIYTLSPKNYSDKQKYGLIDTEGNVIIEPKYERIDKFEKGLAIAKKRSKLGLINTKGEEVTLFKYKDIFAFIEGFALVTISIARQTYYGFIDTNGKEITEIKYSMVNPFRQGKALVIMDIGDGKQKRGYIDTEGNEYWSK